MDDLHFLRLWDTYHGLLTPTQQEIPDLYFNLDLTVSEIAEEKGISRQAVSDCLGICKKQLEDYESKLNYAKFLQNLSLQQSFMATDAVKWAEDFKKVHPEFTNDIDGLLEILNKDYSKDVEAALTKPDKSSGHN